MDRSKVDSSNIASVGYDKDAKLLQVEFKNGGVYNYHDVSEDAHKALMGADSIGKHFIANIRGSFKTTKE